MKTWEEVEANTSDKYLVAAPVVSELINKLSGCSLEQVGKDFYIVGADSVRKKLDNGYKYVVVNGKLTSNGGVTSVNGPSINIKSKDPTATKIIYAGFICTSVTGNPGGGVSVAVSKTSTTCSCSLSLSGQVVSISGSLLVIYE